MLTNHVRIALRHLLKRKGYTFLNAVGLAVGMACCLLIALYVRHELRYDRFHEHADHIYRVAGDLTTPTETQRGRTTPGALAPALEADFPSVAQAVRLMTGVNARTLIRHEGRTFFAEEWAFADPEVFDVFTFPMHRGEPATALAAPYTAVLTTSLAEKIFGAADPVGQTLNLENQFDVTVTGVVDDVPSNSHLRFGMLVSMGTVKELAPPHFFTEWFDARFVTYVRLRADAGAGAGALAAQLPAFVERHMGEGLRRSNQSYRLVLEPLPEIYLHSTRGGPSGSPEALYVFAAIALFVLVIAGINFVNLSTARSMERAVEVGVRKAVGADRRMLAAQFLAESVLLALAAALLALLLAELALPFFVRLAGLPVAAGLLTTPGLVAAVLGGGLVVGLLAGAYPALVLSRFRPVEVLKGRFGTAARGVRLRKGLVVVQLGVSIALMAGTFVVLAQIRHLQHRDPGFTRAQMVLLDLGGDGFGAERQAGLRRAFLDHPAVRSAAASRSVPGDADGAAAPQAFTRLEAADGTMQEANLNLYDVDAGFVDHYGIRVLAGRSFDAARETDAQSALLINAEAARRLGYVDPADAVGAAFAQWGRTGEVVGVVDDFHYQSMRYAVEPLTLRLRTDGMSFLSLHVDTPDWPHTLAALEAVWKAQVPERPFVYHFLDHAFDAQYRAEARFARVCGTFALLAVVVACLGLFGLASFSAQQRTKEIGVRKVLGAGTASLLALLTKGYAGLVAVAFVVAAPLAFVALRHWLDGFAYRIAPPGWAFAAAGGAALALTLGAVGYQALRAARVNPVDALRDE